MERLLTRVATVTTTLTMAGVITLALVDTTNPPAWLLWGTIAALAVGAIATLGLLVLYAKEYK